MLVCVEKAWWEGVLPEWLGCWGGCKQKQSQVPQDSEFNMLNLRE